MSRITLAVTIVIVLAGLAPATAIIGFCARMPCCGHASSPDAALANAPNHCCTTVACDPSPAAALPAAAAAPASLLALPAVVERAPHVSAASPADAPPPIDASPPRTTAGRLAALSTLLI